MQASKEVWGWLFGTIDTREKFEAMRRELAENSGARFAADNSLECRNCHSAASMDITRQSPRAADFHERLLFTRPGTASTATKASRIVCPI